MNMLALTILLPLIGFVLLAFSRGRWSENLSATVGMGSVGLAALVTAYVGVDFFANGKQAVSVPLWTWMSVGDFNIGFNLVLDGLSLTMLSVVTGVGFLIHMFASWYMRGEEGYSRFFAYTNLFIASMVVLVLADNLLLMYLGWEGVGLCSYLLIGFYYTDPKNGAAAMKAFVVTRVGDVFLAFALFILYNELGTLNFREMVELAPQHFANGSTTLQWATLMLLGGAVGKSAQLPLQTWLADAMAGPTPVSALIHAATMVTAGVYLIVRSGAVFVAAPVAAPGVAVIGAITLLFGAIVGSAKDDMKKVLAASTMSQIGYMMLGAGLGPIGWAFSIFHLFTHGFFKALMFLGAGSVMHGMGDQVNMRRFGALRGAMKVTWLTFMMGWLAILGVPPLSGYWSKDKIIEAAFSAHSFGTAEAAWVGWVYGLVALVGAGVTAFYMSRLFFMTFHGKARWTTEAEGAAVHPHESGPLMTVPMIILAVGAVLLGGALSVGDTFINWLAPAIGHVEHGHPVLNEYVIQGATLALVVVGALVAWMKYGRDEVPTSVPAGNALTEAARRDLYQDTVNETLFMMPAKGLVTVARVGDASAIDGALRGLGGGSQLLGRLVGVTQNGLVRTYAAYILGGVILALAIVLGFRL